jgi:hypothetical protein
MTHALFIAEISLAAARDLGPVCDYSSPALSAHVGDEVGLGKPGCGAMPKLRKAALDVTRKRARTAERLACPSRELHFERASSRVAIDGRQTRWTGVTPDDDADDPALRVRCPLHDAACPSLDPAAYNGLRTAALAPQLTSPTMPAPRPLIRIALFRNDLRVHDQPLLHAAAVSSPAHVLPLYCVDPRQFDCTPLNLGFAPATTWHFGLPRAAPFKTRFLVEAVQALQRELRTRKSDLLVRFGEPETVVKGLVEHLAREEGADVEVLCQREVCSCVGMRSERR